MPAERVFGTLYFSDAWQTVFAVDNSVFVWGALLALGLWLQRGWIVALAGAGLLHLALDFPLHAGDGRPHFWPLSDWVFDSPLSYWDSAHHGGVVGAAEILISVGLAAWLLTRFRHLGMRALVLGLVALELSVGGVWATVFA
ncbi:cobalamin biosynthesis protein CobQ [Jannaschia marina]|uniref:cobalamin biosynthesis protein CobQ n=1 Tax=Jannaschia marina TaxID=2741674 RepID=UPI002E282A4E|nr:cobalamin biosynthesis protein CobQ [Jannaschia marina]